MKMAFQKDPLWGAFSESFVFSDQTCRLRVGANPKRIKKICFQKISRYVKKEPKTVKNFFGVVYYYLLGLTTAKELQGN